MIMMTFVDDDSTHELMTRQTGRSRSKASVPTSKAVKMCHLTLFHVVLACQACSHQSLNGGTHLV